MNSIKKLLGSFLFSIAVVLIAEVFMPQPVYAATCTWTGADDGNWNNSANWTGCTGSGVPQDGDSITLPDGTDHKTMTNDISGLDLQDISAAGFGYSIAGNAFTISDGISLAAGGYMYLYANTTLADDAVYSAGDGAFLTIEGDINLNGHQLNFDSGYNIYVNGDISGNGTLVTSGESTVSLFGDNTFTGTIYLEANSKLYFNSNTAAGNAANVITSAGNSITIGTYSYNVTIPNDISISGTATLWNNGESNVYNGDIAVGTSLTIDSEYDPFANNSLTLGGAITGAGSITIDGGGPLHLTGTASNTFGGSLSVKKGDVYLEKTGGAHAVSSSTTVGDGVGSAHSAILRVEQPYQINSHVVSLDTDGWLILDAVNDTVINLSGTGDLNLVTGSQMLLITGDVTFSGHIAGAGGIVKAGGGAFTLTGDSDLTGYISSAEGAVLINGALIHAAAYTNGGLLGGSGTIKTFVGTDGVVGPGGAVTGIGTLHAVETIGLSYLDTLSIHASTATHYDKIEAVGDIALNNATLSVTPEYTVVPAVSWVIVESTTGTVTGQFAGLANGANVTIGGKKFKIVYSTNKVELVLDAVAKVTSPVTHVAVENNTEELETTPTPTPSVTSEATPMVTDMTPEPTTVSTPTKAPETLVSNKTNLYLLLLLFIVIGFVIWLISIKRRSSSNNF